MTAAEPEFYQNIVERNYNLHDVNLDLISDSFPSMMVVFNK